MDNDHLEQRRNYICDMTGLQYLQVAEIAEMAFT